MWPNRQFPADLVTFTQEIFNGKLHFLCSDGLLARILKTELIVSLNITPDVGLAHGKLWNFTNYIYYNETPSGKLYVEVVCVLFKSSFVGCIW